MTGPSGGPVAVLVVCTGNVCRSPAAELLLRAGLGDGVGIEVTSAGLHALAAEPVAAPMARLLVDRGVDPIGFTARQLDPAAMRRADLVLTMTTAQRAAVVSRAPAAVRRTFLLREFAELASLTEVDADPGDPAGRLAALVRGAPRARALRPVSGVGIPDDDVEDPYGRDEDVYLRVMARIDEAVQQLLGRLLPPAATMESDRPVSPLRC
jgi:protein-tyrosine phosphatase